MPILSTIETPFGSELSLSGLLSIDDTIRKNVEVDGKHHNCNDTIDTASCSEWTFGSYESEPDMPTSILKNSSKYEIIECIENVRMKSWIEQDIPSPISSPRSRRRSRISSESSPTKYDRAKTRFPGREGRRRREEPRVRGPKPEKTLEEQWVKTCRFLW